jgi:hypothetical protein
MCDPVESITVAANGLPGFVQASIHENTFAARTKLVCSGFPESCEHVLLQVSAAGAAILRSDSMAPEDAWQATAAAPWLDGPVVTPDDRVLWSRGNPTGDVGDFDVATHTFTTRANGVFKRDNDERYAVTASTSVNAVPLVTAADGLTEDLVELRSDGTLPAVATAQGFDGLVGAYALPLPGSTVRALVPVRNDYADGLMVYTRGAAPLEDIMVDGAPLTHVSGLAMLPVDGRPQGYCAQRGTHVYAVGWDAAGTITTVELPVSDCLHVAATDRGGARIFYKDNGELTTLGYSFAGAFHALGTGYFVSAVGATLPAVVVGNNAVWSIAADGSATVIASGLDTALAGMSADTINVLAHYANSGGNGFGDWKLTRVRSGQAPQTATLLIDEVNGIAPSLVTTVEGAALITWSAQPMIVPSQSMTPVATTFDEMNGGIRDGRTVVFAHAYASPTGALYAYSEVNGTPTFTMLDAPGAGMEGHLIDLGPTKQPTSYFAYDNAATGCKIARFTTGNTLESIPCGDSNNVHVLGTRADGVLVVSDYTGVYTLTAAGAQRIGNEGGVDRPIVDTTVTPPVLVGWSSSTASHQPFSCLAMHADRCWAYPVPMYTSTRTYANAATGGFQHVMQSQVGMGQVLLTIVRSIGPGNFTP